MNSISEFNKYDKVTNVLFINLFSFMKDKENIVVKINRNDKADLLSLRQIVCLSSMMNERTIYIDASRWDFWRLKHRFHLGKNFKRKTEDCKNEWVVDIPAILDYMIEEMDLEPTIFEKIYDAYYNRRTRNNDA